MKNVKVMTASLCLMTLLAWHDSMAAEQVYLHGDTNVPMILNTGSADNDGSTGVFMDITSIGVEDLFKNGLAVKVDFFRLEGGVSTVSTAHFRMTEDGGAWIAMEDGWHSVDEGSAQAEKEAVRLIREEMGKEESRDKYIWQITDIWDKKVKAAETAWQEEFEKLKKEGKGKADNQGNGETHDSVKMPELKMSELQKAEPDKVVEEVVNLPAIMPPVNPVKENASVEMPLKAAGKTSSTMEIYGNASVKTEMGMEADAKKNESRKKEIPAELLITVPSEKEETELTAVKVKGNVQTEEEARKNEKGEITEQVEISIVSHPVVEIISKNSVT